MDAAPAPPITAIDAVTQTLAAVCYLAVALAIFVRHRRDIRARVFLAFAVANAVAFGAPAIAWQRGAVTLLDLPRWTLGALLAGLSEAALLLFHLAQVFPRRRPWIRGSGIQMALAYVVIPLAVVGLVVYAPADVAGITPEYIALALVFGFPLLVLIALVLPVAAILSLVKSYKEAIAPDLRKVRMPIMLIVVSQIAGGALSLVFAPVLATIAPGSVVEMALAIVMWLLSLGTPLAFALAVWQYDVLAIDPD